MGIVCWSLGNHHTQMSTVRYTASNARPVQTGGSSTLQQRSHVVSTQCVSRRYHAINGYLYSSLLRHSGHTWSCLDGLSEHLGPPLSSMHSLTLPTQATGVAPGVSPPTPRPSAAGLPQPSSLSLQPIATVNSMLQVPGPRVSAPQLHKLWTPPIQLSLSDHPCCTVSSSSSGLLHTATAQPYGS